MAWDPVGAAFQLARLTNDVAWGLYHFIDRVKNAPSIARRTQHSLVALKNTLDKVASLSEFPLPVEAPQNESLQSGIGAILESLRDDLENVKQKLQIEQMLEKEESFWRRALYVFNQSLRDEEIRDTFHRIGKYERLLQTHFDVCLLLSSSRTQNRLDAMSDMLRQIVIKLFHETENIEPFALVASVRDRGMHDRTDRYLGALGLYQDASKGVTESIIGSPLPSIADDDVSSTIHTSASHWDDAPLSHDYVDEGIDLQSPSTPLRRRSDEISPDSMAHTPPSPALANDGVHSPGQSMRVSFSERKLEIMLEWFLGRAESLETNKSFEEAARMQKEAINVRKRLEARGKTFAFDEECEMCERLADLYLRTSSKQGQEKASFILDRLVDIHERSKPSAPDVRAYAYRGCRLCRAMAKVKLEQGFFQMAFNFADDAVAYLYVENGQLNDCERILVDEAVKIGLEAAEHIEGMEGERHAFNTLVAQMLQPPGPQVTMTAQPVELEAVSSSTAPEPCSDISLPAFSPTMPPAPTDDQGTETKAESPTRTGPINGTSPELNDDLLRACAAGNVEQVCSLLDRGADVAARLSDGSTCLHLCSERTGKAQVARVLLKHNAICTVRDGDTCPPLDVDAVTQYGHAATHLAARAGKYDVLRELLPRPLPIITATAGTGITRATASISSTASSTKTFWGTADPNLRSTVQKETPLGTALSECPKEPGDKKLRKVCKVLIESGADISEQYLGAKNRARLNKLGFTAQESVSQVQMPTRPTTGQRSLDSVMFTAPDYDASRGPSSTCPNCGSHGPVPESDTVSVRQRTDSMAKSRKKSIASRFSLSKEKK